MDRWFLLMSPAAPGAENMALDEALLERAERGAAPVLRLYSFDPPAITIGAHQDPAHNPSQGAGKQRRVGRQRGPQPEPLGDEKYNQARR